MKGFTFILFVLMAGLTYAQQHFGAEDLWKLERIGGMSISPDESSILYHVTKIDVKENKGASSSYLLDLKSGESKPLAKELSEYKNLKWSPKGFVGIEMKEEAKEKTIVFIDQKENKKEEVITLPSDRLLDFKMSQDGKYLLTLEKVKTKKATTDLYPDYPKANVRILDDLMYRHWDTWEDEYSDQLFVYELEGCKAKTPGANLLEGTTYDGVMKPFSGLENVIFIGDKVIYTSKKKVGKEYATSTDSDLYAYDILTETTENWTVPYEGYDMSPVYHEATQQLAWLSMPRDGFEADKTDIIVRDLKTQRDVNLTSDIDFTVSSFVWNKKGDKIYLLSVKEATYQYFELDVKTKSLRQITEGVHDYGSIDIIGNTLYGLRSSMLTPYEIYKVDIKTGEQEQITHVNDEILAKYEVPEVTQRWVTTSDGKKMLTWVILPPNFDANKKYPTLLYCQGGPQSAVSQFFSYRWNFRLMASQGYVVVAPNRRGLPGFGRQWNDAISKDWGGQPMRDYLAAIDEVSKENFVDKDRRGAVGASYGGYSIFFLAGHHEGRFKSFIAHDGLFNMTSWYGTTEELFFANWDLGGPYWEEQNKKSYEEFSPHKYINNWDTPILIIQGGKDFRVPPGQGLEAFQAAQLKGLKSRLLYFPDENHWILQAQNAMIWQSEFYKWLEDTLE